MTSTPPDISALVIGEALVDVIRTSDSSRVVPGGSPLNVAVGLARLGVTARLVALLGDDTNGALVREHLASAGVDTTGIVTDSQGTSVAQASIGSDGAASYEFDIRWSIPSQEVGVVTLLHVGSIGSWLDPGADSVLATVRSRSRATTASFDPNIRPALGGDRATVLKHVDDLAREVEVLKLSDEDAGWLFPELSPTNVADHFLERGVRLFAMTLGAQGSMLATSTNTVSLPASRVTLADTVGAGDAYMSGLLFALASIGSIADDGTLAEENLYEIGLTATASAAVAVSRAGANPPTLGDLQRQLAATRG